MAQYVSGDTYVRLLPVANTRALLAIDGPAAATFNTIIEANPVGYEGAAGGAITLAAVADGTWVPNVGILTAAANPTNAQATGVLTAAGNATRANAVGTLTLAGQPLDTETVTLDAKVYTFQTVLTDVDGNVLIGATASDSLDNLIAAVTLGAGAGTTYATATTLHSTVTAAAGAGDTATITAKASGVGGNSIATTETLTNGSFGAVTLENGAAAETVTIDATVYTFVDHLTTAFHVLIGATASATLDNLIAAINTDAGAGTTYGTGTTDHPTVTAAAGAGDTVDITAIARGTVGNSIASTEACANMSFGAATLTGGTLETVTIGSTVYTLKHSTNLTAAYDVTIGASASATLDNLIAAINANGTPGTHYFAGTLIHPTVRAFAGAGDTMQVHTNANTILTAVGTLIATTETAAQLSWGAATLADGTDGTNVTFDVTGTAIVCHFASGYSTVSDFEDALEADADVSALVLIDTAGTTPLYQLVVTDDDFSATNLTGGGATSAGAPTLTDGTLGVALPFMTDEALLLVRNTDVATGTTKTADLVLWGWSQSQQRWYYIGEPNSGTQLAEVASDVLSHSEMLDGLRRYTRLYCQIGSLGGAGTEIEVVVDCVPCAAQST